MYVVNCRQRRHSVSLKFKNMHYSSVCLKSGNFTDYNRGFLHRCHIHTRVPVVYTRHIHKRALVGMYRVRCILTALTL